MNKAANKGKVRKRDSQRTQKSLLNAAAKDFAQHGYAGARINRIADKAKCNIRMLYHYFGSKEKLYLAVLESAYLDLRENEEKLEIEFGPPLEGLIRLLEFTFNYFESNPVFEGLLRAENLLRGKYIKRLPSVPNAAEPMLDKVNALIKAGEAEGIFRQGLDAADLYLSITAFSRFHLANSYSLSAVLGVDMNSAEWKAERLRRCREMLEAYLVHGAKRDAVSSKEALNAG
ncbi:MAG: TetR/AcrR family transcriptional regulator [Novosphingobium sp.]